MTGGNARRERDSRLKARAPEVVAVRPDGDADGSPPGALGALHRPPGPQNRSFLGEGEARVPWSKRWEAGDTPDVEVCSGRCGVSPAPPDPRGTRSSLLFFKADVLEPRLGAPRLGVGAICDLPVTCLPNCIQRAQHGDDQELRGGLEAVAWARLASGAV